MARLPMPVLVVAGRGDEGAGDPQGLANVFPVGHAVWASPAATTSTSHLRTR